ncbi:MAG: glycoside hydrolase family 3 C-terminal domain-containing protein [Muribaculaceae bacterium]|nr:glycoside hydrolase family 3 C-terminal domain-containing protein [Muribaculaceae bacterium]
MKKLLMAICTTAALAGCSHKTVDIDARVDELYEKMSQEERIMQLRGCWMDMLFDENGNLDPAKCDSLIPNGIGHFSQFASQKPMDPKELRDRVAAVQDWLIHNTPNGIPGLFHEEVLSGVNTYGSTIYPQQIGQACSFNPELMELKTRQTANALRSIGGVLSLSPMVDVCRNPSFNRLEESYGEDDYLSAVMGTAFVKGLQQDDLRKGVGTCSKHYLGYGGGGDADEKELMEEILLPHEAMIRVAGSSAVMPGYHAVKGTNCVANDWILQDILRDYVGFDGMVVSDYTAIDQLPGKDIVEKAAMAINAGNDVDFPEGNCYAYLQEAIDRGLVKPETLERAVKNVLRYKFRAGLFDKDAYLYSKEDIKLDTPKERKTAYDIASQSVVLLENDGVLPLKDNQKVFVTGPNANSIWAMCGDYSFPSMNYFWKRRTEEVDSPHIVKLLEGMKSRKPENVEVAYSRGCDWTDTIETKVNFSGDERAWEYALLHRKVDSGEKADRAEALRMAKDADVIIAAMGENVMLCGENRDRQGLRLPGSQEDYLKALIATGKPVVLVMFGGRAQVVSGIADKCAAVIQAWYPGEEGGNALADILYGNISPSGKLSVSYPNTEVYDPLCYLYSAEKDPRVEWEFGYGLSYTTFAYSNLEVDKNASTASTDGITVSFDVTNTGKVKADEIAQIYLSPSGTSEISATAEKNGVDKKMGKGEKSGVSEKNSKYIGNLRPIKLQGFARVTLNPGETKRVEVKLYPDQFGYYTNNGERRWNIDPGKYTVKVGASSADIKLQDDIILRGNKVTKPIRDRYFSETILP